MYAKVNGCSAKSVDKFFTQISESASLFESFPPITTNACRLDVILAGIHLADRKTDLLAAKSPPDKAKLRAGGVRWRLDGGDGTDQVKV